MKRILLAGAAVIAAAAVTPALADNVNVANSTGTAAVTVLASITMTQTQGLDFGTITSGQAGDVTINPADGSRQVDGGVGAVAADVGAPGTFQVTGHPNALIVIKVDGVITGFAGGITGVTKVGTLPTVLNGTIVSFPVGGTLSIPAKTPAGVYSGTYNVSVNYP